MGKIYRTCQRKHVQNHAYANKSRRTYVHDVRQLPNTACKNSRCFQKIVQLFNLMRIMLLASLTNTSPRKAGKQQLEIIFQLQIIRD